MAIKLIEVKINKFKKNQQISLQLKGKKVRQASMQHIDRLQNHRSQIIALSLSAAAANGMGAPVLKHPWVDHQRLLLWGDGGGGGGHYGLRSR